MPIEKASLGVHGEHLLADANGNIPVLGEGPEHLEFVGPHPGHPDCVPPTTKDAGAGHVELHPKAPAPTHPIHYADWEHYVSTCHTAAARAANAAKLAGEDTIGPAARHDQVAAAAAAYHAGVLKERED